MAFSSPHSSPSSPFCAGLGQSGRRIPAGGTTTIFDSISLLKLRQTTGVNVKTLIIRSSLLTLFAMTVLATACGDGAQPSSSTPVPSDATSSASAQPSRPAPPPPPQPSGPKPDDFVRVSVTISGTDVDRDSTGLGSEYDKIFIYFVNDYLNISSVGVNAVEGYVELKSPFGEVVDKLGFSHVGPVSRREPRSARR
jgi:hypothetical protein